MKKRQFILISFALVALAGIFLVQGISLAKRYSMTWDEFFYIPSGYSYLDDDPLYTNFVHPPLIKAIMAGPAYLIYGDALYFEPVEKRFSLPYGYEFYSHAGKNADTILFMGRMANLVLGLLLIGLIGLWAYRLWGLPAAILGMGMAALDPNIVAHASLATLDIGATFFFCLTMYSLWRFVNTPSVWRLVALGAAMGLSWLTKYVFIAITTGSVFSVIFLLVFFGTRFDFPYSFKNKFYKRVASPFGKNRFLNSIPAVAIMVSVALLVFWAFYLPLEQWHLTRGLELQFMHAEQGHNSAFKGNFGSDSHADYFFVAWLFKTPLFAIVGLLASVVLFNKGAGFKKQHVFFLMVPVALILAAFTYLGINIGVRYILPIYPLLYVLISRLATLFDQQYVKKAIVIGIFIAGTAFSTLGLHPYQLSYFNELIGGPKNGHSYFVDSNLDWGQDMKDLALFMREEGLSHFTAGVFINPYMESCMYRHYGIRLLVDKVPKDIRQKTPRQKIEIMYAIDDSTVRKLVPISIQALNNEYLMRKHFLKRKPVARIGYSIYIYNIEGDDLGTWLLSNYAASQADLYKGASDKLVAYYLLSRVRNKSRQKKAIQRFLKQLESIETNPEQEHCYWK
jgi:Dolichyl-phosphate-mannose-protein mannosyltransferase